MSCGRIVVFFLLKKQALKHEHWPSETDINKNVNDERGNEANIFFLNMHHFPNIEKKTSGGFCKEKKLLRNIFCQFANQ